MCERNNTSARGCQLAWATRRVAAGGPRCAKGLAAAGHVRRGGGGGGRDAGSSGGQGQERPGVRSARQRVWIENRGRAEAVPIILQEVMTPTPIGVQVTGTPTVAHRPGDRRPGSSRAPVVGLSNNRSRARAGPRRRAVQSRRRGLGSDRHPAAEPRWSAGRDETPPIAHSNLVIWSFGRLVIADQSGNRAIDQR